MISLIENIWYLITLNSFKSSYIFSIYFLATKETTLREKKVWYNKAESFQTNTPITSSLGMPNN